MSQKDALFQDAARTGPFVFDARVAQVLPDMLERSIPGYGALRELLTVLSSERPERKIRAYDLGCSLGAVTMALLEGARDKEIEVVAVDSSAPMIERCRELLAGVPTGVELRCEDVLLTEIERAHIVVLNFTLQFIAPEQRSELVARIARGLEPGGVLVLSEKTRPEPGQGALMDGLHDAFRRKRGYSELEIARKRKALEQVLVPDSVSTHVKRLEQAGLLPVEWFRGLGFVSWLAIKPS